MTPHGVDGHGYRLVLASTSARRLALVHRLEWLGPIDSISPGMDDSDLQSGVGGGNLAQWVASLSYFKAVAGARAWSATGASLDGVILIGADTLVDVDGQVLSKPTDAADAARMIRLVRDRAHEVLTGVTLLAPFSGRRDIFTERAIVHVGSISDAQINDYVRGEDWRGKSGGYNLSERVGAGWPMTVQGDEGTVMGLPIERLRVRLMRFVATLAGEKRAV